MWGWIGTHLPELARYTLEHVLLAATALALATLIAVPLGVWAYGHADRRRRVTTITALLYSVPSIALFAVLVPLLGLGRGPALVGLVVWAQLALVRAVVEGLDSVPADTRDAAIGMGLDRRQVLRQIDLPLALPVFLGGVRDAAVLTIGIATVGAVIDAGGLGTPILQGLQRGQPGPVVAGGAIVAALAIAADRALALMGERARIATGRFVSEAAQ